MNITEIRKLIRQSEDKAWFRSLTINIDYKHTNFEIKLTGLENIYQYFKKELEYFNKLENAPKVLKNSEEFYEHCVDKLRGFIIQYLQEKYAYNRDNEWSSLKYYCESNEYRIAYIFNKGSATTEFLLKLDSTFEGAASGAHDFLTDAKFKYDSANKNYFIGWHRAYEYFTQDDELVKRRNSERQTLSRIRSEYIKNLEHNDANVAQHIAEKEKFYEDKEEAITRLIKKKNTEYIKWESKNKSNYKNFLTDSELRFSELLDETNNSIKDLEAVYKEKLKLEAPAKYWNDRAVKLKAEGQKWLIGLIVCSVIAIVALGTVLYFISDGTIKDLFSTSASAIRWSIVFVTFVSFLAFAIRIFSKLTFSSYHLVRDAEEREQLAYVFLALKKEKNIDPTEQHLIMQSLFSRADSGLLKDDASPTMPGGSMIEKLMGGK